MSCIVTWLMGLGTGFLLGMGFFNLNITPQVYEKPSLVCIDNKGLKDIGWAPNTSYLWVECNNGAKFEVKLEEK